jgi:threonine dehydratase
MRAVSSDALADGSGTGVVPSDAMSASSPRPATRPEGGEFVDLAEIRAVHDRIRPYVMRTPLVPLGPRGVLLKAENLQATGAFKLRGAISAVLQLTPDERRRGIVAHSSGNHAVAVACAGAMLDVPTTVVMPRDAPRVKQDAVHTFGAEMVLVGPASDERIAAARQIVHERGCILVEPYDSRSVVAATATITVEILADRPEIREIYVPISGGGLAAGVARAAALLDPDVRVIGVEPELAADALASRRAGHQVSLPAADMARTAADGLRVQRVGDIPWPYIESFVDEIVTVSEDEIRAAMFEVMARGRLVCEPSGAVPVAAALVGRGGGGAPAELRVAVLSGGNVDPPFLAEVLTGGSLLSPPS